MTIIGKIEWNDATMSVGVQEIDAQHKALVNLINNLFDAVKEGKGTAIFEKLISDLMKYTQIHFTTEERLFDQYNYPEKVSHTATHKAFVDRVASFKKDFDSGKTGLTTGVLSFLRDWLVKHIMSEDRKYMSFFQAKGL